MMTLLLLISLLSLCAAKGCDEPTSTTVPTEVCDTNSNCNCELCSRKGSSDGLHYCIHHTANSSEWLCPQRNDMRYLLCHADGRFHFDALYVLFFGVIIGVAVFVFFTRKRSPVRFED